MEETFNQKEASRLELLKNSFVEFQKKYNEQGQPFEFREPIDDILLKINNFYWEFITFIKENKYVIKAGSNEDEFPKLNRYKIISATELSIVKFQPIKDSNTLNAELALFTAMYLYRKWYKADFAEISFSDNKLSGIWSKFLDDRYVWLAILNADTEFPFFLNSQVWMLVDLLTRSNLK